MPLVQPSDMLDAMHEDAQQLVAKDLGIDNLSLEDQRQIITHFGIVALQAATSAVVAKMIEPAKKEFAALAQGGDPEALKRFLDANVPGHEHIAKQAVQEELAKFKEFQSKEA